MQKSGVSFHAGRDILSEAYATHIGSKHDKYTVGLTKVLRDGNYDLKNATERPASIEVDDSEEQT